jgi:hypothetical protein
MALIKPEQLRSELYQISGSFSGSFAGDGSQLTGIVSSSYAATASFVPEGVGGIYGGDGTVPLNTNVTLTNNINFDSGTFYIDGTSNRVGIGTNNPSERLEVVGTNGIFNTGLETLLVELQLSSQTPSGITQHNVESPNAGSLLMGIRGIDNTSNPGFGEQGDSFIYSSIVNNGLNIISQAGSGTDDYIRFYAGQLATTGNTPDLYIQGSGSTRGYVGIGTTTPNYKLDVNGTTNINGNTTITGSLNVDGSVNLNVMPGLNLTGKLVLGRRDLNNVRFHEIEVNNSMTSSLNSLGFNIHNSATPTSVSRVMTLLGNGNVGIGTITPNYRLDVSGSTNIDGNTTITGSLIVTTSVTASSYTGSFVGDGSQLTGIVSSSYAATASFVPEGVGGIYGGNGTVPLNTTASINGDFTFQGLDEDTRLIVKDGNNGSAIHLFSDGPSGQSGVEFRTQTTDSLLHRIQIAGGDTRYQANQRDLVFSTSTSSLSSGIFITSSNGNVGIGTVIPNYKLDVVGTGNISEDLFVGDTIYVGNVTGTPTTPASLYIRQPSITGSSESPIIDIQVDDANSYFRINNATATDGFFTPSIITRQSDSPDRLSLFFDALVEDAQDTPGAADVMRFRARRDTPDFIQNRNLYAWYNYTTRLMDLDKDGNLRLFQGGLNVNGNTTITGSLIVTTSVTASSYTGSFVGDGSQLTGIISSKWSGSNPITRNSDVEITGSLFITGDISSFSLTGSDNRIVLADPQGTLEASNQTLIEAYINPTSSAALLLDDTLNWSIYGIYSGSAITGTVQGQRHYNIDYFFEAVDDNDWIRLIRG